ncbi:MAG: hypothetical protein AB7O44_21895 [Hyphomicrobiaceae bacterium]
MTERVILSGTCHCGAIRGTLAATKPAAEVQVRACQCGFCTRHGAMTASDPAGKATFEIERAALTRYQFATGTGTSLICARCGMYAGVMLEDGGKVWSVLNVRGLAVPEFKDRKAEVVVYEGETPESRIARRKAKWTPTEIVYR